MAIRPKLSIAAPVIMIIDAFSNADPRIKESRRMAQLFSSQRMMLNKTEIPEWTQEGSNSSQIFIVALILQTAS